MARAHCLGPRNVNDYHHEREFTQKLKITGLCAISEHDDEVTKKYHDQSGMDGSEKHLIQ